MDYAAPGFYRKNRMWYQQVVGGQDMPYIVCGPGPVPDPIIIGPGRRERKRLEDIIVGGDDCVKNQKEAPLIERDIFEQFPFLPQIPDNEQRPSFPDN